MSCCTKCASRGVSQRLCVYVVATLWKARFVANAGGHTRVASRRGEPIVPDDSIARSVSASVTFMSVGLSRGLGEVRDDPSIYSGSARWLLHPTSSIGQHGGSSFADSSLESAYLYILRNVSHNSSYRACGIDLACFSLPWLVPVPSSGGYRCLDCGEISRAFN